MASVSSFSFSSSVATCRSEMTGKVVVLAASLLLCCWPCSVCAQEG